MLLANNISHSWNVMLVGLFVEVDSFLLLLLTSYLYGNQCYIFYMFLKKYDRLINHKHIQKIK